ncbi:MAG: TrmH family RNA methyltransferase [Paludibacteraceae bacterium]
MLSKTKINWINSFDRKKNRDEEGLFVAEGVKIVSDLLPFLKCRLLAVCEDEFHENFKKYSDLINIISADEYKKITFQKSPQGVLAVFEKPEFHINKNVILHNLNLALDDIQDPGNLGTIIRLADWFGIKDVFCSLHSADVFSPKTVQATMGAIARVQVHYVDLPAFLNELDGGIPIFGTFMTGHNIYTEHLSGNGFIIMGNEGRGISAAVEKLITHKISIPNYPNNNVTSESLNVSIATAITVAEFRRRIFV